MKTYIRQIKPYIQPPALQGFNCNSYPVEGYDWVSEDLEQRLRDEIVVKDSMSALIFKERFVVWSDGVVGDYEGVPISCYSTDETELSEGDVLLLPNVQENLRYNRS